MILCPTCALSLRNPVPTAAPTSLVSPRVTSTSLTVTWHPPPLENHNGILTHYVVRVENQRTRGVSSFSVSSSSLLYTAVGLSPYTTYECSVAAGTINGTGPLTSELSVQTSEDG